MARRAKRARPAGAWWFAADLVAAFLVGLLTAQHADKVARIPRPGVIHPIQTTQTPRDHEGIEAPNRRPTRK